MTDTIAVLGAGPVGLAAAAELTLRGLPFRIYERAGHPAASVADWRHVRLFSPMGLNVAPAARHLLDRAGVALPDDEFLPTGASLIDDYLAPLAALPAIARHLTLDATVEAVTRAGLDRVSGGDAAAPRVSRPFMIHWRNAHGIRHVDPARAVIDATGCWGNPSPAGVDGLPVAGEDTARTAGLLATGIPDVAGRDRAGYAGCRVLVIGGGHSAMTVVLELLRLRDTAPRTRILWALRRKDAGRIAGGGTADGLPARGALGSDALAAAADGRVTLLHGFAASAITVAGDGTSLLIDGHEGDTATRLAVDRVVVATGLRPDLSLTRELRLSHDPVVEAPPALAPLIDPNLHSCGSVPPHGVAELHAPAEPGYYVAGGKSYGRAPTFLMATGYEQVRSVVAELAGDHAAARDVRLVLPETGVCSTAPRRIADPRPAAAGCCGSAA